MVASQSTTFRTGSTLQCTWLSCWLASLICWPTTLSCLVALTRYTPTQQAALYIALGQAGSTVRPAAVVTPLHLMLKGAMLGASYMLQTLASHMHVSVAYACSCASLSFLASSIGMHAISHIFSAQATYNQAHSSCPCASSRLMCIPRPGALNSF